MNKSELLILLQKLQLSPKKTKGQNFLIDKNVRDKIIQLSNIDSNDIILEVGPGPGILTEILIQKAKKVIAIELEPKFCSYLKEEYNNQGNLTIINGDILDIDLPPHNKVISNLPFSATGPIIEKLFFKENAPEGTLIIEKKIGERIMNKGDYKTYSRITVGVNCFMKPVKSYPISQNCFYPAPKIEISLIKLEPIKQINPFLTVDSQKIFFLDFIAGIMPYKNKDIINAIRFFIKKNKGSIPEKEKILSILKQADVENKKVFSFTLEELITIAKSLVDKPILE